MEAEYVVMFMLTMHYHEEVPDLFKEFSQSKRNNVISCGFICILIGKIPFWKKRIS